MSLKKTEEERLEKQEGTGGISSENASGSADKRLLSGTVQFYEDILTSIPHSFLAVYNSRGKHLEVWTHPVIVEKTGIDIRELKGKLITEVFEEAASESLTGYLHRVIGEAHPIEFQLLLTLPKGNFNFMVFLAPLPMHATNPATISAIFTLMEKKHAGGMQQPATSTIAKEADNNTAFVVTNHKGIISGVSDAFAKQTGYSKDYLTGYKITHIPMIQPKDVVKFERAIARPVPDEQKQSFEWEYQNKDGLARWSIVSVIPLIETGILRGFRFGFTDITERKLFEKDLLKSRQTYKIIIENADEGIFVLQNDRVRFSNAKFTELINFPADHLQRKSFTEMVHPDDRDYFKTDKPIADKDKIDNGEEVFRIICENKSIRYFRSRKVVIDWDNNPAMLFYVADITSQKQRKDELKGEIEDIRQILDLYHEFGELPETDELIRKAGEKIREISGATAIIMIGYSSETGSSALKHIVGSHEIRDELLSMINPSGDELFPESGLENIRGLSSGRLIRYNDGVFEEGSQVFYSNVISMISRVLKVGGIYLLGFSQKGHQYGNAILIMPVGKKPEKPFVLEDLAAIVASRLAYQEEINRLKRSEQKFRQVFDSLQDVYFTTDIDGIITEVSPSITNLTGFEPREVIGKLITDFYMDQETFRDFSRKLLRENAISDYDIQCRDRNGKYIYASLNVSLLRDKNKKVVGSKGFLRDISMRKKAEEEFQKSEEKFRTLADFTYDWEYWISNKGEILYMSPSCERISGYTREEFMKNPRLLSQIVFEDDYEAYLDHSKYVDESDSKEVEILDYRINTKEGETRWINQVSREVYNGEGQPLGRRISNRDITERKLAEQELKNSEERFRTLFFESPDAVFVEDYDGVLLDVNPAACKLYKMTREELVGKSMADLVPEEKKAEVIDEFPKWLTGDLKKYRGLIRTAEGKSIPVELHGSKINFSGRKAMLFIVRDITDVVEKEKKLKESIEKAEEADMLKSAFLANVSHEIRTPMNAIIGFSEILTNQDLSKKEREEFIQYITQGSNTLMNLIEDIIDITKIEAGQIKIEFDDCNVGDLLDELYATFLKMKNKSGRRELDIRLNKPNVDSDFTIHTDPNRIRQILSNLLGNAIKFTKEGGIEFGFNLREPNQIIFYVRDTGIGIPEDKLDLIFERFGQVRDHRNGDSKGTGLGLSISRKLSELLGGTLTVESEVNKGSTFYLTLPVKESSSTDEELATAKAKITDQIDWSDKLFLIAEDSILNYTFLEALFQRTKVKLLWAKNGREAVELCRKNKAIDLVLMDIKMPILSGLEAIAEIKKFRKDLPIIVQTAYAMPEDRERSLEAGGDEHLTKPINADELFSTISRFVS